MSSTDAVDLLEELFDIEAWVRERDQAGAFYHPTDEFRDLNMA